MTDKEVKQGRVVSREGLGQPVGWEEVEWGEGGQKPKQEKSLAFSFPSPAPSFSHLRKGSQGGRAAEAEGWVCLVSIHRKGHLQRKHFLPAPWARLSLRAVLLSATGGRFSSSVVSSLRSAPPRLPATSCGRGLCFQHLQPRSTAPAGGEPGRRGHSTPNFQHFISFRQARIDVQKQLVSHQQCML